MVSLSEVKEKIFGRKEELARAREQIEAYPTLPPRTRTELMRATPRTQVGIRELTASRLATKEKTAKELAKQEAELTTYEEQVMAYEAAQKAAQEAYQKEKKAYEYAKYALETNRPPGGGPPGTYKWYKKLWSAGYPGGTYAAQLSPPGVYVVKGQPVSFGAGEAPPEASYVGPPGTIPKFPETEGTYRHIITGEMMSALEPPSPAWQQVSGYIPTITPEVLPKKPPLAFVLDIPRKIVETFKPPEETLPDYPQSTRIGVREMPTAPPTVVGPPPGYLERARMVGKEYFERLSGVEDYAYGPIIERLPMEIPYGAYRGLIKYPGEITGEALARIAPPGEMVIPEQRVPQKVTIPIPPPKFEVPRELVSPEKIEEFKPPSPIITPEVRIPYKESFRAIGEIVGRIPGYYLTAGPVATSFLYPALKKGIPSEERVEMGIIGGIGAMEGIRYLRKPIIEYKIPKPRYYKWRKGTDILVPIRKGEKAIELAKFKLIRKTPPIEVTVTRKWRELIGVKKPIIKGPITPTRFDVLWAKKPPIIVSPKGEAVGLFYTKRVGAKYGTEFEMKAIQKPIQKPITLAEFKKLPKTQQYILQKIVEKRIGYKPKLEDVPKFLPKGTEYFGGGLITKRLVRVKPTPRKLDIWRPWEPGRDISRFKTVSISKKLPIPKEAPFEKFITLTGVKPTPKPFPRMAGKVELVPGITYRFEPIDITATKFRTITTLKAEQKLLGLELVKKPPMEMLKTTFPKVKPPIPKVEAVKPTYVGFAALKPSPWYGKRVAVPAVPSIEVIPAEKLAPMVSPTILPTLVSKVGVKPLIKLKPKVALMPKEVLKVGVIPKVTPAIVPKVREALRVREVLKVAPKLVQKPALKPTIVPKVTVTRVVSKVTPTKIPPPPFYWWLPSITKAKARRKPVPFRLVPKGFIVKVRKRGKLVPIVPFGVPKGEALWLGRKAVKAGAAATFILTPTPKAKPIGVPRITEKALLPEFRKPIRRGREIKEPFTFIQRRPFRIKTPGELREITMVGWKARRKKNWWL